VTFEQWWATLERELAAQKGKRLSELPTEIKTIARGAWNAALDAAKDQFAIETHSDTFDLKNHAQFVSFIEITERARVKIS
jgi:hypothetical protein